MTKDQPPIIVPIPYVEPEKALAALQRFYDMLDHYQVPKAEQPELARELATFFKFAITHSAEEWIAGYELAKKWDRQVEAKTTLRLVRYDSGDSD